MAQQDLGMPEDIAAELRSIGARIETQRTAERYAPLQRKEPYSWLDVARDLKYGPHEPNALDVFTAPIPGAGKPRGRLRARRRIRSRRQARRRPTALRQHRRLGRQPGPRRRHDQLSARAAEHVAAGHRGFDGRRRLAQGEHRAVRGSPSKIVLWGHSAGAAHVAHYVADATKRSLDAGIASAVVREIMEFRRKEAGNARA